MRPLRERNLATVGIVGTIVIALALLATVVLPKLPMFDGQTGYHADIAQTAGLQAGDEVRVAGVHAGFVTHLALHGQVIRVDFAADSGLRFGRQTTAAVGVATILGRMYLEVQPKGGGRLPGGALIPLSRTSVPFTLPEVERGLDTTTTGLDTAQLQKALDTLSATFTDTPQLTRGTIQGLSRISAAIARRGQQLGELLDRSATITATLSAQRQQLVGLLGDSDLVLEEIVRRRQVIQALLDDTAALSRQVTGLVTDNAQVFGPLLADLKTVTDTLRKDDAALQQAVLLLGPTARYVTNAVGNGPWLDILVPNLVVPDNVLCRAGLAGQCR